MSESVPVQTITPAGSSASEAQAVQGVSGGVPIPITGTISASTTAHATAAAPSYTEGTDVALSCDLTGNLRVSSGGAGGSSDVALHDNTTPANHLGINASGQAAIQNPPNLDAAASTLAKESGGHLASIDAKIVLPTVLDASGFLKVHEQGTAAVSGTVTANAGTGNFTVAQATAANLNATVTGTVAATQSGAPWSENVTQFGGTNLSTGTGAGGAGIPRVTVSNDSAVKVWDGTTTAGVSAKGTQASNFVGTQDAKDSGRQQICLVWEAQTMSTSESALANFTTGTRNGASLTAASSYTVTTGKTLRIQQVNVFVKNITTATAFGDSRVRIRQAASSIANTSPIIWEAQLGWNDNLATAAVNANAAQCFYIPDGLEVAATQQVTMSHLDSTANGQVTVVIMGYEY